MVEVTSSAEPDCFGHDYCLQALRRESDDACRSGQGVVVGAAAGRRG